MFRTVEYLDVQIFESWGSAIALIEEPATLEEGYERFEVLEGDAARLGRLLTLASVRRVTTHRSSRGFPMDDRFKRLFPLRK